MPALVPSARSTRSARSSGDPARSSGKADTSTQARHTPLTTSGRKASSRGAPAPPGRTRFRSRTAWRAGKEYLNEAIESALATKSIELDLQRYERANDADHARTGPGGAQEIADRLRVDLADARRYINTPAEEELVDELGRRVDDYLASHREARERGLESADARAIFAVADQGVGIQPGEHEQIFEPFQRTGASRDLVPGVGLGLSIARRVVEAHGGRIEITSKPGCGSTFRVYLPRSKASNEPPARS